MATRTKLTPFARLLLFLIVFLPLAYFGAAYFNGEDPIANVKSMVKGEDAPVKKKKDTYNLQQKLEDLEKENSMLRKKVKSLEAELAKKEDASGTTSTRKKWGK